MISPGSQVTPILPRSGEKAVYISPDSARKPISISARPFRGPIPISRKQRIKCGCRCPADNGSWALDKGNYSECSERVRKPGIQAWDPLFSPGVHPTPRTRVVHPLLGVRRPGRSCVAVCLRAHGWPLRVRLDTDPVHTYRVGQRGDGERPVGWHGSCYAYVRALQRKEVRVARSVTKFTTLALRCVQCT